MLVFVGSLNFSSLSALLIQDLKKSPAKGGNIHDLWRNWTIGLGADCNQSVLRCRCFVDFWWHSSNSWYILSFELKLVQSIPLSRLKSRKFIPKSWPNFQNHVFESPKFLHSSVMGKDLPQNYIGHLLEGCTPSYSLPLWEEFTSPASISRWFDPRPLQVAYILHGIHGQPLVGNAIIVGYLKQHLEGSDSGVANGCRRFPSLYLKKVQNLSMMTFDDINILVLNRFDWISLSKVFFVCKIAGALLVMPFATWGSKLMAHFTKSAFGRGRFK